MSRTDTLPPSACAPSISVIVRSMDRPSLAAALASVAAQDADAVEVVLVNALGPGHGPTPATAGVHPVHRVDAGHALRRSAAANAGLDAARARSVIFLDDDDVFLPGHLVRLARALAAHPEAVAAYADVELGHEGPDGWVGRHVFAADFDALRLRFENFLPLHGVLVDRGRDAVRHCRFDEALDLFEDWDWWLQLQRLGAFVRVPGVSARYCATPGAGSGVFADDTAAAQARERLLLKWLAQDGPAERLALLQALQHHYRAAQACAAQLALTQRTEQDLRDMLAARERDAGSASAEIASLRDLVAAREREIHDAVAQIEDLRLVLAARDQEIANGHTYIDSLRQVLAARDQEIDALKARGTAP